MMPNVLAGWIVLSGLSYAALAQGTKLWTVDRYDELARGNADGIAIRSDGRLEPGPATSMLAGIGISYVWAVAADSTGNGYAGVGGTSAGSAAVIKIAPDGRQSRIFEGKELAVQAVRVLADGSVVAATSPDGKVYRVPAAGGAATVLFDPANTAEKPKYIWDVVEIAGTLFVATGAPAAVYRLPVSGGGGAELLFRTTDQHIRCLLPGKDGILWAGSDGSGVLYRMAALQTGAKPFAVYTAPRREITALAIDAAGVVYAAGVGAKGAPSLPPLPVTGSVGVGITLLQPGSATAASTNTVLPDGSEIYRIGVDGAPSKLLALKEDVVYSLAVRNGSLLAATGNRGRVYRVDTEVPGRFTDVAHLEATQGTSFAPFKDGLLVGTSNSGKIFKLRDRLASPATYTSTVFDAQGFAQWGRAEVRANLASAFDLYVRSGNTESPLMGWSDWFEVGANAASVGAPPARFAQWKTMLREGAAIDAVSLNYLQSNVAPVVDEIVVQPGARMAGGSAPANTTVQISFPAPVSATPTLTFPSDSGNGPLTAQKDKTAITVRWAAHDDNGDDLLFSLYYKGTGETNWHLLKDRIADRFLSFDASLLPDGSYQMKVVASDAPAHTASESLKGEKVSDALVIDTTPPVPGALTAALEGSTIHARLEAHDATSPIAHAEYSVDAGPWQYLEPTGRVSDSQTERYDFHAPVPNAPATATDAREHLVAVRVYDRYENVASVKTVVR